MPTDSLRKLFRRLRLAALPGVLMCLAFGCDAPYKPPLLLGTNAWLGYEPLYLSRDLGYWTPEQVHLVEYLSSSETLRAFRNREIDAAALTLDEVLLLLQDGVDIKAILITDVSLGGDAILVRPGIGSVKALKGHRVAVESSALGAYILSRALELNGMGLEDIKIVHQTANEHIHTFDQNVADAVVGFEPVKSQLLGKGARVVFDSTAIPGEIVDVVVVRPEFLQQRPESVDQLLRGWFKAIDYLHDSPADAAMKMSVRMQMQPQQVIDALAGIHFPGYRENLHLLGGETPRLLSTAARLNRIMLAHQLIETKVDSHALAFPEALRQMPR